jgi:hypothetical protein
LLNRTALIPLVMPLFLLDNFCRYICDGRLEMRRERNEIVLNY